MARIRSIKPETWTDPEFVACSPFARLLWIGAWNLADDYGVLKDDPAMLHLRLLPGDNVDAHALVDELVARRLLLRRVAPDGTQVLVIRTFCLHQKIDKRSPGRWGLPEEFTDAGRTVSALPPAQNADQDECRTPAESRPIPTDPDLGTEGTGTSLVQPAGSHDGPFAGEFSEVWDSYPRKRDRKAALAAYRARRRAGVPRDDLLTATKNYAASRVGEDQQFTMLGSTFFGPHDRWMDWLKPEETQQRSEPGWVER